MSSFMQIRPVGGELCDVDRGTNRRTDTKELTVDLSNFLNVLTNSVRTSQKTK